MKRASTSLPVPDSPAISTVQSLAATRRARSARRRELGAQATSSTSLAARHRRRTRRVSASHVSLLRSFSPRMHDGCIGESEVARGVPGRERGVTSVGKADHTRRRQFRRRRRPSIFRRDARRVEHARTCAASRRASCGAGRAGARRARRCRSERSSACVDELALDRRADARAGRGRRGQHGERVAGCAALSRVRAVFVDASAASSSIGRSSCRPAARRRRAECVRRPWCRAPRSRSRTAARPTAPTSRRAGISRADRRCRRVRPRGDDRQALDEIAELAHVARPRA